MLLTLDNMLWGTILYKLTSYIHHLLLVCSTKDSILIEHNLWHTLKHSHRMMS